MATTTKFDNCNVSMDDKGVITITIDTRAASNKPSSTGKSRSVGSTRGNKPLAVPGGDQVFLGVNCYKQ